MDKELLKILVCPVTKGPLVYDKDKKELINKINYYLQNGMLNLI